MYKQDLSHLHKDNFVDGSIMSGQLPGSESKTVFQQLN